MVIHDPNPERGGALMPTTTNVTRTRITGTNLYTTDITSRFRNAASSMSNVPYSGYIPSF